MSELNAVEVTAKSLGLIERDLDNMRREWDQAIAAMEEPALRAQANVYRALQGDIDEAAERAAFVKGLVLGALGMVTGPLAGVLVRKGSSFWKETKYTDDIVRLNGRLAVLTTRHTSDKAVLAKAEGAAQAGLSKASTMMVDLGSEELPDYKSASSALDGVAEVSGVLTRLRADIDRAFTPLINEIAKRRVDPRLLVPDPALDEMIRKRVGDQPIAFVEEIQRQLLDWYLAKRSAANLWNTRPGVRGKADNQGLQEAFEGAMWALWVKKQKRVTRVVDQIYGPEVVIGGSMRPQMTGGRAVQTYDFDKRTSEAITKAMCINAKGRIDTVKESDALDRYMTAFSHTALLRLESRERTKPTEFRKILES